MERETWLLWVSKHRLLSQRVVWCRWLMAGMAKYCTSLAMYVLHTELAIKRKWRRDRKSQESARPTVMVRPVCQC
ncbi:hypothetical protein BDW69DRAFT_161022 [Aspergillus filifer]